MTYGLGQEQILWHIKLVNDPAKKSTRVFSVTVLAKNTDTELQIIFKSIG
jgi:hypothetical protein